MRTESAVRGVRVPFFVLVAFCILLLVVVLAGVQTATKSVAAKEEGTQAASVNPQDRPWMNRTLSAERRADLLIEQMTLDEKITLVHGVDPVPAKQYVGYVSANPRLGIPAITLADGRAGVGNDARDITLLPAPIAAASGWDTEVMNTFGHVLGQEQRIKGTDVALGPSIDVVRVPEWGRTFESYGEDPYFNGRMAVAEIKGIQSEGLIADANMYATMNQEDNRFEEDSRVDERTLQEIYLPPFAAAVREGHVGTIMCAYVKTNGVFSCENQYLLVDVLRKQWGFDGWVMSDWGATHSAVDAANHGHDQEMPGEKYYGAELKAAVLNGQVSTEVLNSHVRNILVPLFQHGIFDRRQVGSWSANARSPQHDAFARTAAEQGTVLLKNEAGILPLSRAASVAVIGEAGSTHPKAEGGGSSAVVPPYVVSPLDGIRKRLGSDAKVTFANGVDPVAAAKLAQAADIAIVFARTEESEGADRPDLSLPGNQDALINAVAQANKKTIVVLNTGGPVLMPWLEQVRGVIEAWYAGQEAGNAIAAILYGDANPSAKLPLTFPRAADAIPTSKREQWPGVGGRSLYSEGLNVGYRWYDQSGTPPLFPFGFGLSYTTFRLDHLVIEPEKAEPTTGTLQVKVEVINTGQRKGAEVVEVYVGHPPANDEPPHQLRAFAKLELKPGESRTVTLALDSRSFSIYDPGAHRWIHRRGSYEILAGDSSRDLPLHGSVMIR